MLKGETDKQQQTRSVMSASADRKVVLTRTMVMMDDGDDFPALPSTRQTAAVQSVHPSAPLMGSGGKKQKKKKKKKKKGYDNTPEIINLLDATFQQQLRDSQRQSGRHATRTRDTQPPNPRPKPNSNNRSNAWAKFSSSSPASLAPAASSSHPSSSSSPFVNLAPATSSSSSSSSSASASASSKPKHLGFKRPTQSQSQHQHHALFDNFFPTNTRKGQRQLHKV
jgi:hypothetical protein